LLAPADFSHVVNVCRKEWNESSLVCRRASRPLPPGLASTFWPRFHQSGGRKDFIVKLGGDRASVLFRQCRRFWEHIGVRLVAGRQACQTVRQRLRHVKGQAFAGLADLPRLPLVAQLGEVFMF
jgi:hypothetical protein